MGAHRCGIRKIKADNAVVRDRRRIEGAGKSTGTDVNLTESSDDHALSALKRGPVPITTWPWDSNPILSVPFSIQREYSLYFRKKRCLEIKGREAARQPMALQSIADP